MLSKNSSFTFYLNLLDQLSVTEALVMSYLIAELPYKQTDEEYFSRVFDADIMSDLNISRQAVWKAYKKLAELGFLEVKTLSHNEKWVKTTDKVLTIIK